MRAAKWLSPLGVILLGTAIQAKAETLTWDQAVAEAAANNPQVRSAQLQTQSAVSQTKSARGAYFPRLSADLDASRTNTEVLTSDTTLPVTRVLRESESYSARLTLSQNLFSGFGTAARIRETDAGEDLARSNLASARTQVSQDLKSAFAELIYVQQNIELSESIVQRRQENVNLVQLLFEGGRENRGSVAFSRAALGQAKLELEQARRNRIVARQALARVLGRESGEDLNVVPSIPLNEPPSSVNFESLLVQTPEYTQAQANTRVADARVGQAFSALLPNVDLVGSLGRIGDQFVPENNNWSVGVSLTIPLFSGGTSYYGLQSARSEAAAAASSATDTARRTLTTLKEAYSDFALAIERVKVNKEFVAASQVRAEIARTKYNNGLLSFENWDIIENDLINRQRALLQSQRDRIVAEATWERAQGRSVVK